MTIVPTMLTNSTTTLPTTTSTATVSTATISTTTVTTAIFLVQQPVAQHYQQQQIQFQQPIAQNLQHQHFFNMNLQPMNSISQNNDSSNIMLLREEINEFKQLIR